MRYFLPSGLEIKEYDKFVQPFVAKDYGDVMTREEWLSCVASHSFIPWDGTLGEIVVNGQLTVYELQGWGHEIAFMHDEAGDPIYFGLTANREGAFRIKPITMDEFKALEGEVQVCWYNK